MRTRSLIPLGLICSLLTVVPATTSAAKPGPASASPVAQDRSVEPVVISGSQLPGWSAGPEVSAREPVTPLNSDCADTGDHSCSQASRIPTGPREGVPVDRLVGYRWNENANRFVPVPFQVDERATRYLSNIASNRGSGGTPGFGAYSAADAQLSYVWDREGYRFTHHSSDDPCHAVMGPGDAPEQDPLPGLDDNDELVLLYRDTGPKAPAGAPRPKHVAELRAVRIDDPSAPDSEPRYAYVGLSTKARQPAEGYVRYVRDADADRYEPTSGNYGNAPRGPICDDEGNVIGEGPRRPRDTAWVLTPRYAFRYEGRWILRGVHVAPGDRDEPLDDPSAYGPALIDQWKARAYQQRPGTTTVCCGFETEQDNWGASSVLLGERAGPVRVIRATWGADSGTNTVRQEIFYPDAIVQQAYLRVHPIPPLGGIFSYWDHTAGVVTKYYNPQRPDGVDVDGRNDEVFGNLYAHAGPDKAEIREDDPLPVVGPQSASVPLGGAEGCRVSGQRSQCSDMDVTDPTLQAAATLTWEQVSGPHGALVFGSSVNELTPGNTQAFTAIPYYRDDATFDDGTGIDPGPHLNPKDVDDGAYATWTDPATGQTHPREHWTPEAGSPTGDPDLDRRWFQGAIGSHGVQVLFVAESDNAFLTAPVTEISTEQRMVVLPGDPGNVGDRYGHARDLPLRVSVVP